MSEPLREQIAHALEALEFGLGGRDPHFRLSASEAQEAADAVLALVAARDAERQAAITALRRPPAFDRDASSVRHGYNAALADVLAILRGGTDA